MDTNGSLFSHLLFFMLPVLSSLIIAAKITEIYTNSYQDIDKIIVWWLSFLAITAVQNILTSGMLTFKFSQYGSILNLNKVS